ncbi:MAG TPA: hypothetical protein PKW33_20525 [Anaerolineaceae bacterium]|nr:hypothetical protein [Anaerolineaceae bacterium]HPN53993.1 hypothetical protein [Anaerolineaceae bacterium]
MGDIFIVLISLLAILGLAVFYYWLRLVLYRRVAAQPDPRQARNRLSLFVVVLVIFLLPLIWLFYGQSWTTAVLGSLPAVLTFALLFAAAVLLALGIYYSRKEK